MRKGFTLIEMLACVALAGGVMAISAPVFMICLRDVPHARAASDINSRLQDAIRVLRADAEDSVSAISSGPSHDSEGTTLSLKSSTNNVKYEFVDGVLTRTDKQGSRTWDLPGAIIEWKIREQPKHASRLEVFTAVSVETGKRFANRQLFFVGLTMEGRP